MGRIEDIWDEGKNETGLIKKDDSCFGTLSDVPTTSEKSLSIDTDDEIIEKTIAFIANDIESDEKLDELRKLIQNGDTGDQDYSTFLETWYKNNKKDYIKEALQPTENSNSLMINKYTFRDLLDKAKRMIEAMDKLPAKNLGKYKNVDTIFNDKSRSVDFDQ